MGFMVQSVCLGPHGETLQASPLDARCASLRKLRVGEALPYHKDDWPSRTDAQARPAGDQRGDSFPLVHPQLGLVAFHTFDWGDGIRRFGVYDGVNGDGGSLVAQSGVGAGGVVGSVMTIDQTGGVQLFVDPANCRGAVGVDSLLGWRFGPAALSSHPQGVSYEPIGRVRDLGAACPARNAHAITVWRVTSFAPMRAPGVVGAKAVRTLVSEHYSGFGLDASPNMERMYFSAELGRMRWERWQNLSLTTRAGDQALASRLAEDGRCPGGEGAPRHAGQWIMVRCHEWTNIVPAANKAGDSVMPWLAGLTDATRAPLLTAILDEAKQTRPGH